MFLNERLPSNELRTLRSLNTRSTLPKIEYHTYLNLEKGLAGELYLDERLKELPDQVLILRDLTLEVKSTTFQIDTLLIFQNKIHTLEVKNNQGNHYIENEIWRNTSGNEMKNPYLQMTRCTSQLRQLFQRFGYNDKVNSSLVFVNPEFTLYQAPRNLNIVFPTQLNHFIKKLKTQPCNLNQQHHRLAKQLLKNQVIENRHERTFSYDFKDLKKGVICFECYEFMNVYSFRQISCKKCKKLEPIDNAVLRNIDEFIFLFPDKKMTRNQIYEWCDSKVPVRTIRRVLNRYYIPMSQSRSTYYVKRED